MKEGREWTRVKEGRTMERDVLTFHFVGSSSRGFTSSPSLSPPIPSAPPTPPLPPLSTLTRASRDSYHRPTASNCSSTGAECVCVCVWVAPLHTPGKSQITRGSCYSDGHKVRLITKCCLLPQDPSRSHKTQSPGGHSCSPPNAGGRAR